MPAPVAVRWANWARRGSAALIPPAGGATPAQPTPAAPGPAFPSSQLDLRAEIQLRTGAWIDITDFVRLATPATITRGRADESQAVARSTLSLTLDNTAGRFSSRNPLSPYFGLFGKNTPIRASLPATPYLDMPGVGAAASAPDAALLDVTGDLDVRIDLSLPNWRLPALDLCGKYRTSDNQRSWALRMEGDGRPFFQWSPDGTSFLIAFATRAVPARLGRLAVRVTLDVDDGAGNNIVTFYTAASIDTPDEDWAQLGDPVITAGTTAVFAGAAPIEIGDVAAVGTTPAPLFNATRAVTGRCYGFELRNGIGGTVVANPDFTAQAPGTAWFLDTVAAAQNLWTLGNGAQINDRRYRFWGEVSEWPPRWDMSGNDITVTIEASGILRRLGTGDSPLKSVIRRAMTGLSSNAPIAYWPAEEESGATVIASGLAGGKAMTFTGTPNFGGSTAFACSAPLPTIANSTWSGVIPGYSPVGDVQLRFLLNVPVGGAPNNAVILRLITSGTCPRWDVTYQFGGFVALTGYDGDDVQLFTVNLGDVRGALVRVHVDLDQNGADIDYVIAWTKVGSASDIGASGTLTGRTVGRATRVYVDPTANIDDTGFGHLSVHPSTVSFFTGIEADQLTGYDAEPAARRFARLCAEEGIAFEAIGGVGDLDKAIGTFTGDESEVMGPQRPLALPVLLQECVDADLGIMYEPRHFFGLGYRSRGSLYAQTRQLTLDHSAEQIAAPPEPSDDDRYTVNDFTATREGGSSARAIVTSGPLSVNDPPGGVGPYDDAKTINVQADDRLPDQATWRAHLGTVDEIRYGQVGVDLAANPELADDAEEAEVGDVLVIGGPLPGMAPDDSRQLIQGSVETMKEKTHTIVFNCSPASPYDVVVVDESRADTSGSTLMADAAAAATALIVDTPVGPPWTTDPAELPIDIDVGGEVIRIQDRRISDTFDRAPVSNGWGLTTTGEAWSTTGGPVSAFSTTGSKGRVSLGSVSNRHFTSAGSGLADLAIKTAITVPVLALGGSISAGVVFRYTDENNLYLVQLLHDTAGLIDFQILVRVAGVFTTLASVNNLIGYTPNIPTYLRATCVGTQMNARIWQGATEPAGWHLTASDATFAAGAIGTHSNLVAGNTNTLPVAVDYDDLDVLTTAVIGAASPQTLAVVRSINGVVKPQSAGTSVGLASPAYAGL